MNRVAETVPASERVPPHLLLQGLTGGSLMPARHLGVIYLLPGMARVGDGSYQFISILAVANPLKLIGLVRSSTRTETNSKLR